MSNILSSTMLLTCYISKDEIIAIKSAGVNSVIKKEYDAEGTSQLWGKKNVDSSGSLL